MAGTRICTLRHGPDQPHITGHHHIMVALAILMIQGTLREIQDTHLRVATHHMGHPETN